MSCFGQDLAYAIRTLRRRPLFAITAVMTLSLGIGAATSIFTVLHGVILRPLPYDDPDGLVHILGTRRDARAATISYPDFDDLRGAAVSFESVSAWQGWEVTLRDENGTPTRVRAASVSNTFFDLLGVQPVAGRSFNEEEGRLGHVPAVVLSYPLWRRMYGGDGRVVDRTLELEGENYTIVGVAPPGFIDPVVAASPFPQPELWRVRPPVFDVNQANRSWRGFRAVGRLRGGATMEEAQREADVLAARLEEAFPQTNTGRGFAVDSFANVAAGDVRGPLVLLMVVVALVLLIACTNVTNLLLSNANARRGEFAVRVALGAGRRRLVAQLLTESFVLALLGAAGGLGLAVGGTNAILALGAHGIPRAESIDIDATVLAFGMSLSLITTILFGLAPALRVTATARNWRDVGGARSDRLRSGLVVGEIAMAIMILVAAGLVTKSLWHLSAVDSGMDVEGLLTFRVTPEQPTYPTTAELAPLLHRIEERLGAVPGVVGAGVITDLPMSGAVNSVTARRGDRPPPAPGEGLIVLIRAVTPSYFRTAGIPVRRGRNITDADRTDGGMVMVINRVMAERLFTGEDPVGKHVTTLGVSRRIIGVVGDVRDFGPARVSEPVVYIPYAQIRGEEWMRRSVTFFVRTTGDPREFVGMVRETVGAVDRAIPINDIQPMTSVLASNVAAPRFRSVIFGLFGLLGLGLAAVGIGGVMAFNLSQRYREIAIRLAMGAEPAAVTRLILSQAARLTGIGALLGLGASVWLGRLMSGFLFGVDPHDPSVFATVATVLGTVTLFATYLPARRAARMEPAAVLRSD